MNQNAAAPGEAYAEQQARVGVGNDICVSGEGLTKSFAGRKVLDAVDIDVRSNRIHALLGANGSGKSTLVKLLTGVYWPDAGTIKIGGKEFPRIGSPYEANQLGIAVVHQEAPLIDSFTVSECFAQFRGYPLGFGKIDWRRLRREVGEVLEKYGVDVGPDALAGHLTAAERALVAMVIALDRIRTGLRMLVLDEVTASLPRNQAEPYLDHVVELASSGIGVLMVTHRLAELRGRASDVTLLRDGKNVFFDDSGEVMDSDLVAHMTGTASTHDQSHIRRGEAGPTLASLWRARGASERPLPEKGARVLEAKDVSGGRMNGLDFEVRSGEIVGMVGLADSGVGDLPRVLAGQMAHKSGTLVVNGHEMARGSRPSQMIRAGVSVLPSDRLQQGGIASLPLSENVLLPDFSRYWHKKVRERDVLARLLDALDVRPRSSSQIFGSFSGGNQQKAILGKWLLLCPSLLVLDDPTNGVDPGAREQIFGVLREAAEEGVGVLVFSTEPEQLANVCTRILVLREGAVVKELAGEDVTAQKISEWCYS